MKKNILLVFMHFSFLVFSQAPVIEWQKCLGGSSTEYGNSTLQTSDGGYVVVGSAASSNNGDVSGNVGRSCGWIVKLNKWGVIEWQNCLGGVNSESTYSICQTLDGGYIVTGSSSLLTADTIVNYGRDDLWVIKLNSLGIIEWQKGFGGTGSEYGFSIDTTSEGGYVIAGQTNSTNGNISGNQGGIDGWIVKINSEGEIEWQKCLGGSNTDRLNSIKQTLDGGYITAGETNSQNGNVGGNKGGYDFLVVKLSNLGDIEWQKCLGGSGFDSASSIQQTSDGGYIVAGQTASDDGDVSGVKENDDFWVVKLSNVGTIEWQKRYGGSLYESANSVQQTFDNGFVVAGQAQSNDGDVSGSNSSPDSSDFWVIKLSSSGSLEWQKCLGGSSHDTASSIQQSSDMGYIVIGTTTSEDGEVSGYHGGNGDIWIVKLSAANLSTTSFDTAANIMFSPNPTHSQINFSQEISKLAIFDIAGKKVKSFQKPSATFDVSNLEKGVYVLNGIAADGKNLNEKLVKK